MSLKVVQSWGVASARHTSGTLVYTSSNADYLIDLPIGPSITRWDIAAGCRLSTFQAHTDAVTSMRMSPDQCWVATACYSGGVKLWNSLWSCVHETMAPMGCQHHLAWSHDSERFIVIGNGLNSAIVAYDIITTKGGDPPTTKMQLAWQVNAEQIDPWYMQISVTSPSDKPQSKKAIDYPYVNAFLMGEFTSSGQVLAVKQRPGRTTIMMLYDTQGQLLRTADIQSDKPGTDSVETLFLSLLHNSCYALGLQGGRVLLVREDLTLASIINVGVTGRTCVWDGACLVLPTDSATLIWWSMKGLKVKEVRLGPPDTIVRVDWSISGQYLWVCAFSALRLLKVTRNEKGDLLDVSVAYILTTYEISCCGVGFSPNRQSLASGDLTGNVWVTDGTKVKTAFKCNVGGSVRCLVWRREGVLLVGGLDGQLTWCEIGGTCKPALQLEGSVIVAKLNGSKELLAVGTTKGMLEVYSCSQEELKLVTKLLAHPAKRGAQDDRFGQLTIQSEVWSLCWSPTGDRIATCSEDQTTRIWNVSDWQRLTILTGHTMAVTSVDWKDMGGTTLLASCSDDRTVRVHDGDSYQLQRVMNTMDIYGWHTLTYLSFHPAKHSPLLAVTTQNGHVVVWDSFTGQMVFQGKIHLGSIEGLCWCSPGEASGACESGGTCEDDAACEAGGAWVATVGADCVVNWFTITNPF